MNTQSLYLGVVMYLPKFVRILQNGLSSKMIAIERRLFVDNEVALDGNYTREAECWCVNNI